MVEPPCCGDALRLTIDIKVLCILFLKIFSFPPNGGGGKRERERKREKERKKGDKE